MTTDCDKDPYGNLSYLHPLNRLQKPESTKKYTATICVYCGSAEHLGINCRSDNIPKCKKIEEYFKKHSEYSDNIYKSISAKLDRIEYDAWRNMNEFFLDTSWKKMYQEKMEEKFYNKYKAVKASSINEYLQSFEGSLKF